MTRLTLDAATVEKLQGLSQFLELCDEQGNVLGRFEPNEDSPAFRSWLRQLDPGISEEEMRKREQRAEGVSTEQLLAQLQARS